MAQLNLKNVHKSFGANKVIHGVDLDVADGEFTVFVVPSGCGKSTLLRMIAGLETVTSGAVCHQCPHLFGLQRLTADGNKARCMTMWWT